MIPWSTKGGGRSRDNKWKTERHGRSGTQELECGLKIIAPAVELVAVALCGTVDGIQAR